jgi:DNA-binding ferritin-like protein (Dps family)
MKHIKEYSDDELKGLQKDLKSAGYQKPLPHDYLSLDDFFEETIDHDEYVDVSGPSVEMSIDELISDYQERINGIPKQHQGVAGRAIKQLWIEKIENAFR